MEFTSTPSADLSRALHLRQRLAQLEVEFLNHEAVVEVREIRGESTDENMEAMEVIEAEHKAVLAKVRKIEKDYATQIKNGEFPDYVPVEVKDEEKKAARDARQAKLAAIRGAAHP